MSWGDEQRAAVIKLMKDDGALLDLMPSDVAREFARANLMSSGILWPDGKLGPNYGGDERPYPSSRKREDEERIHSERFKALREEWLPKLQQEQTGET